MNADQLNADLESGDPQRVKGALETIDRAWRRREFVPLTLPEPGCLSTFGEGPPLEVLALYLSAVEHYPAFAPSPTGMTRRHAMVEAVIGYGRGELTSDLALLFQIQVHPDFAVTDALDYIRDRDLSTPHEVLATRRLVEHLLDSENTRRATVDVLRFWSMTCRFPEIIEAVRPLLQAAEWAAITSD